MATTLLLHITQVSVSIVLLTPTSTETLNHPPNNRSISERVVAHPSSVLMEKSENDDR